MSPMNLSILEIVCQIDSSSDNNGESKFLLCFALNVCGMLAFVFWVRKLRTLAPGRASIRKKKFKTSRITGDLHIKSPVQMLGYTSSGLPWWFMCLLLPGWKVMTPSHLSL